MAENADLEAIAGSVENFTVDFHRSLAGRTVGNFVSSALSAHVVLSMTASGAGGSTAREMRQALKLGDRDEQGLQLQGFQNFIDALNNISQVTLEIANKIYASKDISIKDDFKQITSTYFRSESETVDFSNAIETAKEINGWCSKKTNNKIKEIVDKGDLNPSTRLILLNAIYFKGSWKHKFDEYLTEDREFHTDKTTIIKVPTMFIKKKFYFQSLKGINAFCVALPYENENMYMLIIVPREIDGLESIEKNLDNIKFDSREFSHPVEEVNLYLPKFKVESTIDLNSHLNELGMNEMFSNGADFNGISEQPLKIDKVIQKAFIEVNEEGCEAAAVTAVLMVRCMMISEPPITVKVDRPFLYKIMHKNFTLFSGRVTNPCQS